MYHAFNPTEMEMIAGLIRGCQHIEVPKRGKNDKGDVVILEYVLIPLPANVSEHDLARPYTMLERFLEAVKLLNNTKKVKFENCKYHANNNTIEAIGKMDAKREAASKYIFEAIKDNNQQILEQMWQKHKSALTSGRLNFTPVPFQPLELSHTVSDLENLAHEQNEVNKTSASALTFSDPVTTTSEPVSTTTVIELQKRKAGRPPKVKQ